MSALETLKHIRTHAHIRGLGSLATHTGPRRDRWPRLRETERLQRALARLRAQSQTQETAREDLPEFQKELRNA
jgi:hypothetical protein